MGILTAWFGRNSWPFGHLVARDCYNEEVPTPKERGAAWVFFTRVFPQFVLCMACLYHYLDLIHKTPPDLKTRSSLFEWFVGIHDAVNHRLLRPTYGVERARNDYFLLGVLEKQEIVWRALQMLAIEHTLHEEERRIKLLAQHQHQHDHNEPRKPTAGDILKKKKDITVEDEEKEEMDKEEEEEDEEPDLQWYHRDLKRWDLSLVFHRDWFYLYRYSPTSSSSSSSSSSGTIVEWSLNTTLTSAEWFTYYMDPLLRGGQRGNGSVETALQEYQERKNQVYKEAWIIAQQEAADRSRKKKKKGNKTNKIINFVRRLAPHKDNTTHYGKKQSVLSSSSSSASSSSPSSVRASPPKTRLHASPLLFIAGLLIVGILSFGLQQQQQRRQPLRKQFRRDSSY